MQVQVCVRAAAVSIHAFREEGDTADGRWIVWEEVSIHAFREEGDTFP